MKDHILSIDQGTTGTTVSVINNQGAFVASSDKDFAQIYPKPGWVEHDPEDIWAGVVHNIKAVLLKANLEAEAIAAIGITNQRETVIVWDRKTGKPIYNAIVWQCRRTADFCDKLKKNPKTVKIVKQKTGLVLDPYFSASKIRWILENVPGSRVRAQKGELAAGTIDCFLLWRLTGGAQHATDVSNASRTQLMDIQKVAWDEELLKIFNVPSQLLPQIRPSSGEFGVTKGVPGLADGISISGIAGDQQAALFGQACFQVGEAKCTFGTGSFLLMNTGKKAVSSKAGCLTTIAWQLAPKGPVTYALEGSAFISGAAVQWLRDELQLIKTSDEIEALAASVADSGGVEFVPALSGLGVPHWNPHARGLICGLTRGSSRAHLARATLEALALQNTEILFAMKKDSGKNIKVLKVDGGASSNNLLMQLQSDYLGVDIIRPSNVESTTMGAAFLAGLGVGIWKELSGIEKIWKSDREFKPNMTAKNRQERIARWHKAIERACLP